MKLQEVKINNYKSFGEEKNVLYISNLNTVIGKNESGKTNIIEAIGGVIGIGKTPRDFFNNINRQTNGNVNIELTFKFNSNEKKKYGNLEYNVVTITDYKECAIDEKFGDIILKNKIIANTRKDILEYIEQNNISITSQNNIVVFNKIIDGITNLNQKLLIRPDDYQGFKQRIINSQNSILRELVKMMDEMFDLIDDFYPNYPDFIIIRNEQLKKSYTITEISKELQNEDSMLYMFLKICQINIDDFYDTANSNDNTEIVNNTIEFNNMIKSNFINKFNNFYHQEVIDMMINFDRNVLNINIKTKGKYLTIEERSNGLRWYINLFIQLLYNDYNFDKSKQNKVILLDEPGVFLHSIAQEELTKLLYELSNNNQVIYTTHSPSMINMDRMQDIRAIEKDVCGVSCIYNKISQFPTDSNSKYETIEPIIKAMGYKMKYNIGPSSKKINIIVEGITDYLYLHAYMHIKKIKNYNIIASTGADNIPAIASILYGWGCNFFIILDNDHKGRGIYDSIKSCDMPFYDRILFANNKEYDNNIDEEIEILFSLQDRKKYGLDKDEYKDNKYFYAYALYENVTQNTGILNSESITNFDNLFQELSKKQTDITEL